LFRIYLNININIYRIKTTHQLTMSFILQGFVSEIETAKNTLHCSFLKYYDKEYKGKDTSKDLIIKLINDHRNRLGLSIILSPLNKEKRGFRVKYKDCFTEFKTKEKTSDVITNDFRNSIVRMHVDKVNYCFKDKKDKTGEKEVVGFYFMAKKIEKISA
jgi:hypothetical protein